MLVDESTAPWPAVLREDWGVEHLVEALRLGEGFRLHILSCDSPRTARAILRYLEQAVDHRLRVLRPADKEVADRPIAAAELFSSVLEPLAAPLDSGLGPWMLAIDASGAQTEDEPAWRALFRRMNERRNGIVRHLDVPLLLCVSPRIEVAFAQEAPDFWSIRSSRVDVPSVPLETFPAETSMVRERAFHWPVFSFESEQVSEEIARARRELENKPGDVGAQAALCIWLARLGRLAAERSDFQQAASAYEEAMRIRSALAEQHPANLQMQADYAASLMDLGYVEEERWGLEKAQALYESALDVLRRLLECEPDHPEWRSSVAVSCHQLGMLAQKRGDLSQAQDWYQKSLRIEEELGDQVGIAISYHQLGILAQKRGDLPQALDWYQKSLRIKEEQGNRTAMASTYHQLGRLAQDRGDLPQAQDWYQKSLQISEELGNRTGVATTYHQLGMLAQDRGELTQAQDWYQKSLRISEELGLREGMAKSIGQLGRLATERGHPAEGVSLNLRSLAIRSQLGSPETMFDLYWLRRQREQLGEERFGEILRENLDSQAMTEVLGMMEKDGAAK